MCHSLKLSFILLSAKDPKRKTFAKELEEEESLLKQCVEKLKSVEASRVALVSQLKEALHEQVVNDNMLPVFLLLFCAFLFFFHVHLTMMHFIIYSFAHFPTFSAQESELENVRTQMQVFSVIDISFNY